MNSCLFSKTLMTDALVDLRTSRDDAPLHHHDFFEIAYVISGSCEHTIDEHSSIIKKGDFFFFNLKSCHAYAALSDDFEIINCLFVPEFIDRTLKGARSFSDIMNNYPQRLENSTFSDGACGRVLHDTDGFVLTLLTRMLTEFKDTKRARLDLIRSLLMTLLISFAREDEEGGAEKNRVTAIKKYIAESYMNTPTLSEISERLGISLTYASIIFKRAVGVSFLDYLLKFRIEVACDLLRCSNKTVAEISQLVGYSDPAFFYKAFKSHVEMSPGEYRRKRRE
ncbi:MAG: helix-turn-helix domain-containing protein [Clostridia bacterium]|nr:helix-turn-helix domain-containing protein [Clostridia bacterium]